MDAMGARYAEVENVDPRSTVSKFIARWAAQARLDMDPGLVSLRLVKLSAGVPLRGDEAAALTSPGSLLADPSETLALAGVADGSWLLACVAPVLAGELT